MLGLKTAALRTLTFADREAALELCRASPVANVMVMERLERAGQDRGRLGGELWGYFEDGRLTTACWLGVNIVPWGAHSTAAITAIADRLGTVRARFSSIFGDVTLVLPLWERLAASGWRPREVRPCQPLLSVQVPSLAAAVLPDPLVRRGSAQDVDAVFPASVAMFAEEVGYCPKGSDGGAAYRRRVAELLEQKRTFLRTCDDGQVVFKADIGSMSSQVGQIQGVWIDLRWRGQGLAAPAMAAVVLACAPQTPTLSLYVNDYNARALAAYRRVGFEQVGTFASVLF